MAFFDDVKRGLTATGKQVAKRTKEISGTVQVKTQLVMENEKLEHAYAAVGKKVFESTDEECECLKEEFDAIRQILEKKAELEAQLSEMDGSFACPACGARLEKGSAFCNKCGAKIEKDAGEEKKAELSEDDFVAEEEVLEVHAVPEAPEAETAAEAPVKETAEVVADDDIQ